MEAERLPAQVPRRRVLFENEDTDVPELTPAIVNGYIRKIIVYAPDKSSGHCRQKGGNCWIFLDGNEIPEIEGTVVYQRPPENAENGAIFWSHRSRWVYRTNSSLPL